MKICLLNIAVVFLLVEIFYTAEVHSQSAWQSNIVYSGSDGKLVYVRDTAGNCVPDFSHAGYKGGGVDIPYVDVVKTISPVSGDNTSSIQNAINEVSNMPLNSNGIRGAILLLPGTYEIDGTIQLNESGIVLRGSGDGSSPDSNSILLAVGDSPHQRTVLVAGGGSASKWKEQVSGTKTNITSDTVLIGTNSFEVQNASPFKVGDNIIIYHPCTDAWLQAINYGGTHSTDAGAEPGVDVPWAVNSYPIVFNRNITKISGNTITIDVPVFNTLIKSRSQCYIYKYARTGIKTNIGIENLRIDIQTAGGTDENHAWQAIDLYQIEDSWIKDCTMLHFGQSAVRTNTATRITVEYCNGLDPVSQITGERMYNFNVYTASQQILFYKCLATNGRHHFVSNGTTWTSGCVFLDCTSQGIYASSEGHRAWSMALLYDNLKELDGPRPGYNPRTLGLYNRGNYGTSHGWAAANSVAWNCDENNGDIIIQKPPTAQNYAIGCFGKHVTGVCPPAPFNEPQGYIEGANQPGLTPQSLYIEQLNERLGVTTVAINNAQAKLMPGNYKLEQNYPNPFSAGGGSAYGGNPTTTIRYTISTSLPAPLLSKPAYRSGRERGVRGEVVTLKVYDILGREVKTLVNKIQSPGSYEVEFSAIGGSASGGNAGKLSSGIYFYRIEAGSFIQTRKMILAK